MPDTDKINQYISGSAAGVGTMAIRLPSAVVNLWLINQILDKPQYGMYAFALAIVAVISMFGTAGLERSLLYRLSGEEKKGQLYGGDLVGFALIAVLIVSVSLAAIVISISVAFIDSEHSLKLWLIAASLTLPFVSFNTVFGAWYQANNRVAESHFIGLVRPVFHMLMLVGAFYFFQSELSVAFALTASAAISTFAWLAWTPSTGWRRPKSFSQHDLTYGFKLLFTRLAHTGIERVDILMVGILASSTAVADYAIASRLANFTDLGNKLLNPIFTPRMRYSLAQSKLPALYREYGQNRLLSFGIALLMVILFLGLGQELLGLFGEYRSAWPILVVLGASYIFHTGYGANGRYLNMAGYANLTLYTTIFLLAAAIALNLVLIPYFGALGAAFATVISILLVNVLITYLVREKDGFKVINAKILIIVLMAGLISIFSAIKLLSSPVAIILLSFLGLLFLIGQKSLWKGTIWALARRLT